MSTICTVCRGRFTGGCAYCSPTAIPTVWVEDEMTGQPTITTTTHPMSSLGNIVHGFTGGDTDAD